MTDIKPGDLVDVDGRRRVVVDVSDDGWAILRPPDDLEGHDLAAVEAKTLTAVGHVDSVPGWVEDSPGRWRRL